MVSVGLPRIRKLRSSNDGVGKLWKSCNRKGKFVDSHLTTPMTSLFIIMSTLKSYRDDTNWLAYKPISKYIDNDS